VKNPPTIVIDTDTATLYYEAGPSTYQLPWKPLEPESSLQILNAFNQVRKALGLSLLRWSYRLEQSSWFWNRNCVPAHDPQEKVFGENILSITSAEIPEKDFAIGGSQQWLSEISNYACETDTCVVGDNGKLKECGHFVQAIWNASVFVGCSMIQCKENSPFHKADGQPDMGSWTQMVCRFDPPAYEGDRPLPKTSCSKLNAHKAKGSFTEVPKISTGVGPLGRAPGYGSEEASISTGAKRVVPK
jgi:hypothetical protein